MSWYHNLYLKHFVVAMDQEPLKICFVTNKAFWVVRYNGHHIQSLWSPSKKVS